ncbi:MAG: flavin reductase family protein [Desulfobacterales bacterium]
MTALHFMSIAEKAMTQIEKGAFLTVKAGYDINTMTIGWATMGICWKKPVFMVAVRDSRHTFTLMERAEDFTVSIPLGDMKKEIAFCGTRSGRDTDKFAACGLKTAPAQFVQSPIVDASCIHIECRIVHKSPMNPEFLIADYLSLYPERDFHTLYFGEIQACYERR